MGFIIIVFLFTTIINYYNMKGNEHLSKAVEIYFDENETIENFQKNVGIAKEYFEKSSIFFKIGIVWIILIPLSLLFNLEDKLLNRIKFLLIFLIVILLSANIYLSGMELNTQRKAVIDIEGLNTTARLNVTYSSPYEAHNLLLCIHNNINQSKRNYQNCSDFYYEIKYDYWKGRKYIKYAKIHFPDDLVAKNYIQFLKMFLRFEGIKCS